jgi:hypothetical protein
MLKEIIMSSDNIPISDSTVESSKDNDINTSVSTTGTTDAGIPGATGTTGTTETNGTTAAISQTSDTLTNINTIKDELCKLPLNPCESEYILNSVFPLVNTVYLLSTSAVNLANSANILTLSPIVHSKKSEVKKILDLVYDMDEECEDLFKVIKKRLKVLTK